MNKKNTKNAMALNIVVKMILLLMVFLVVWLVWRNLFAEGNTIIKGQLTGLRGDCDGDGVMNLLDKCCNCNHAGDSVGVNGCIGDETEENLKTCGKCPADETTCNAK